MTEIAIREPAAQVAVVQDVDSWTQVASQVIKLAGQIADTPFVPDGLRGNIPATAAAILAGRELGLPPMTSLANVHVIKGKPALSAVLMRALIQAQGHQWQDVEVNDNRATVRARRRGESEWSEATFTAEQAKRAGIPLSGYPQDKLYARATSRLARRKFADVIAGMPYSAEELEDEPGDTLAIEPARPTGRVTAADITARPSAPLDASPAAQHLPSPPADREPAGEAPAPPGDDELTGSERHGKLVGVVRQHFKRLGFGDDERDQRLVATAALAGIGGTVASTKHLDEDELSVVANALGRCKNRDALIALMVDVEAAGDE